VKGTIKLRIPGWTRNDVAPGGLYSYPAKARGQVTVSINGSRVPAAVEETGYISLDRQWKDGDVVDVELPIETRWVVADERVRENRGRMAVERGPIVYCVESPDVESGHALGLLFERNREPRPEFDRSFFGGVTVLRTEARSLIDPSSPAKPVKLVPYYLWANRGPAEMSVWLSAREYAAGDTGPAGGLIFYVNPNFAADGWRYLEAAPFDQSAGASGMLLAGDRRRARRRGTPNRTPPTSSRRAPNRSGGASVRSLDLNSVKAGSAFTRRTGGDRSQEQPTPPISGCRAGDNFTCGHRRNRRRHGEPHNFADLAARITMTRTFLAAFGRFARFDRCVPARRRRALARWSRTG
jgi:hypothetical protein